MGFSASESLDPRSAVPASAGAWVDGVRPAGRGAALAFDAGLVLVGSLLIAACAQVAFRIPATPWVPVTLQTFGVLVVASALGGRRGALAVVAYLGEGAAGMPVFAQLGAGVGHLVGPTGGYLAAFVPAAYLTGRLVERGWDRTLLRSLAAMALGTAVIFLGGLTWLAVYSGILSPVAGSEAAFATLLANGLWPFLPGAAVKIVAASALLPGGARLRDRKILHEGPVSR